MMVEHVLTNAQRDLLVTLSQKVGVIWVRGHEADAAISLAATRFVALGPSEPSGAVTVLITDAGREALAEAEKAK